MPRNLNETTKQFIVSAENRNIFEAYLSIKMLINFMSSI